MQQNEFHSYPFGTVPKRLTDFFQIEPEDIVGRTEELAQLRTSLCAGHATALVHGIGGIGKTTLARVYVARHWEDYRHVVWLTVAAPQSLDYDAEEAANNEQFLLRDAFLRSATLREHLGVAQKVEEALDNKDLDGAFQLLLRRLGELTGCLIVLDNANSQGDLQTIRPDLKRLPLHVLVTSRARPLGWDIVEVNELPVPQAIELFRQHYAHPSLATATETELETLAKILLCHPLLLELVGKSASSQGANLPFPRLLESVQNRSFHDEHLNKIPVDAGDYADGQNLRRQASVEAYISLIFNHISQLAPEHCDLLKAMTLLSPAQAYNCEDLMELCKMLSLEFHQPRAEALTQQGWLRREPLSEGGIGYALHPLLLDVAFRELGVTADWADAVIERVANIIDYDSTDSQHDLREKRTAQPLAEHLGKLFFEAETGYISLLLDNLRRLEQVYGFYQNAARLGERALTIAEKNLSEEIISVRQVNLSNIYQELGKYTQAKELLEAALASDLKIFGAEHPKVALCQSNLANVYRNLSNYIQAQKLLEASLVINLKIYGEEHPKVAINQSILGLIYQDIGDYIRARELLDLALTTDLNFFGVEHPNVAVRQSNLGLVYRNLGEYVRARDLLELALASDLKNFGTEHPTVAVGQSNLANVYGDLGDNARARDLLELALASAVKNFGAEHPTVAVRQSNLANVYGDLGDNARARDLLELALASDLKNFGAEHPTVAVSQSNLATVYRNLGEYVRARDLLEAALASDLKNFGAEHPVLATRYNNLAHVYWSEKNYPAAIEHLTEALRIVEKTLGQEHPDYKQFSESLEKALREMTAKKAGVWAKLWHWFGG